MDSSQEEKIILASTSTTRRKMLRRVGLEVTFMTPNLNESKIKTVAKQQKVPSCSLAVQLAEAKAGAVATTSSKDWIIGADQVLACGNVRIDKAENREEAGKILEFLSGQSHELHTATCVIRDAIIQWSYVDTTKLWMRKLSPCFIEDIWTRRETKCYVPWVVIILKVWGPNCLTAWKGANFQFKGWLCCLC